MWINVTIGPQRDILSLKTGLILGSGVLQVIITTVCYELLVKGAVSVMGERGAGAAGKFNSTVCNKPWRTAELWLKPDWSEGCALEAGNDMGRANRKCEAEWRSCSSMFFFPSRSHSLARRWTTPGCERKEREERGWESQLGEGILGKSLPRPFQPSPLSTDIELLWSFQTADSKLAVVTCRRLWAHSLPAGYRWCFFKLFLLPSAWKTPRNFFRYYVTPQLCAVSVGWTETCLR